MKKALLFTTQLAGWFILLFSVAITLTFLSEYLSASGFFGDYVFEGKYSTGEVYTKEEWGIRHYWYNAMGIILFIISLARIGIWAIWYWGGPKEVGL